MADETRSYPPSSPTATGPELPLHLLQKLRIDIPGYELLDELGTGGQATVYRARELTSGLTVAVKVLHGGQQADPAARERFRRETAALKALNHPNIVFAVESGQTPAGLDYLVMNFVDGRPLDALWKDRKFAARIAPEPPARLRLFKRICDVVQSAHRKGITHRDLSPSNILLDSAGEPHILDFGLAATAFDSQLSPGGQNISMTGQFIGKLKYASPEQARGTRDSIDIRSDVYSLGVILYQILTGGAFPYEVAGNIVDVLNNIIHSKPTAPSKVVLDREQTTLAPDSKSPRRPHAGPQLVNPAIEAIVLKALEKDPAARYESAGTLGDDIERYLAGLPTMAVVQRSDNSPITRGKLRRPVTILITLVIAFLSVGVLMNARTIFTWFGLSGILLALGAGPSTLPAGGDLSVRQQNLLMQLADTEANIQAINAALKVAGYKVGQAYDKIDSNLKGNEYMNRKGGGPVRWDEFYGKTAKAFGKLNTAKNGDWGDRRPQQFDFVYKANDDQIARAKDQIASLGKNQDALLERRQQHETNQMRLWALLSFEEIKDREIGDDPLCRFKLTSNDQPADVRARLLRSYVLFLRSANTLAADGAESLDSKTNDANKTVAEIGPYLNDAYKILHDATVSEKDNADLADNERKALAACKSLCKDLADECKNISENASNADDRAKAKEDNSKLAFRLALQDSLSKYSNGVLQLSDEIIKASKTLGVSPVTGTASGEAPRGFGSGAKASQAGTGNPAGMAMADVFPLHSQWTLGWTVSGNERREFAATVTQVDNDQAVILVNNDKQGDREYTIAFVNAKLSLIGEKKVGAKQAVVTSNWKTIKSDYDPANGGTVTLDTSNDWRNGVTHKDGSTTSVFVFTRLAAGGK